jgi:hypothetical protein
MDDNGLGWVRLSELEYIAFGIVAVADLGTLEFPLALGGIYDAT